MAILQLPALGTSQEQVQYVMGILDEHVTKNRKGLQLLCPKNIMGDLDAQKRLRSIAKDIPSDYVVTFHAPFDAHVPNTKLDLSHPDSVATYCAVADLATEIGAQGIIIHTNTVFTHDAWKPPLTSYTHVHEKIFPLVYKNLAHLSQYTSLPFHIENMCFPLRGDRTLEETEIPFDPYVWTYEGILHFLGKTSIQMSFDTSHYGIVSHKINEVWKTYHGKITAEDIAKEKLKVYPQNVTQQPSLVDAFTGIQEKTGNRITHVQIADYKGSWLPKDHGGRLLGEGLGVGEGDFGEELLKLVSLIDKTYPEIPISLDVDVQDYLKRPEQIESLKRVLEVL